MKKKYILIAIASVVLASCSSDNAVVVAPPSQDNVALVPMVNVVGTQTKAIIDGTAFDYETPIGLVLSNANSYTPLVFAYKQEKADSDWKSLSDNIYLSNKEATIYGFYPCLDTPPTGHLTDFSTATVDYTNNKLLKVKVDAATDFKGTAQNDYMYATAAESLTPVKPITASNSAKTVNLWFHHALSKLTFKLNKDAMFVGTCKVTKLVLESNVDAVPTGRFMTGTAGTMKLDNGLIEGLTASSTITLSTDAGVNVVTQDKETNGAVNPDFGKVLTAGTTEPKFFIQALVAPIALPTTTINSETPASTLNSIRLTLTVQGDTGSPKEMSVFLTNGLQEWKAGKHYAYTISIGATALEITKTVNVIGWGDADKVGDLTVN